MMGAEVGWGGGWGGGKFCGEDDEALSPDESQLL